MKKTGCPGFSLFLTLAAVCLLSPLGCKRRSTPAPGDANAASPNDSLPKATFEVTVQPATGIAILLDGVKVADNSPYKSDKVAPGPHTLQVRGMGFYTLTLPVEVQKGISLRVPVSLRARPTQDYEGALLTGKPDDVRSKLGGDRASGQSNSVGGPARGERRVAERMPDPESYPELAHGLMFIDLAIQASPPAAIIVDGVTSDGSRARLRHGKGLIRIGDIDLPYEIMPGSVLELFIPTDRASWFKDAMQLKGATLIKFNHGTLRLRRKSRDNEQSVSMRRVF